MSSYFSVARIAERMALRRMMGRLPVQMARRSMRKPPKLKSFRLTGLRKVMPRLFRRGYGLGVFRKKRRNRRRIGYRRKTQNKVHSFIRWADKDTLYPSSTGPNTITETGADQNLAYSFKLDNVVNPTDFTNLYDMYRINKVTLHLESLYDTTASGNVLGNPNNRRIRVVHDYNDNNPLTQEDDYLEYSNCKSYPMWSRRGIKITLFPKINNTVENSGGTNAFTSVSSNKVWLNIADDEVPHFGIKIFIPAGIIITDATMFRVRAKFHLSFKNSK